jgi:hypothetical protein
MRICFVAPPSLTEPDEPSPDYRAELSTLAENAPTGILTLAAVLEQRGIVPAIIDLNRLYYDHLLWSRGEGHNDDLCAYAAGRLAALDYDLYGLGTICSSYPLTIRIADALKRLRPGALIVLGGPQASVVDVPTLDAFPFIDLVVRGEAEESLPLVVDALQGRGPLDQIPGVTYRSGGRVRRTPNGPVVRDLDALPMPAFHLYPDMGKCRRISVEMGRGCPFACTFCSTNDFFRRNFRLKSPPRVIEQMTFVQQTYGVDNFELIHDMFTVDRRKVAAFCHAVLECGSRFEWYCSARTDCVDDDLLALMASAGCRGVFFGVETGSPRLQKIIDKHLDLSAAARRIECAERHQIATTVSLIVGFPEEEEEDLAGTIHFLLDSLRHDRVLPQLHMLAALAGTPLHTACRERLTFDAGSSDISSEIWTRDLGSRLLISEHRDIFPDFYAVPGKLDRNRVLELRDFVLYGATRCRWLLVALHQEFGDFLGLFDRWRVWMESRGRLQRPTGYYVTPAFANDLLEFVDEHYLVAMNSASVAAAGMLRYQLALRDEVLRERRQEAKGGPAVPDNVFLLDLDIDVVAIMDCLRRMQLPREMPWGPCSLAVRQKPDYTADLLRLPPMAAQLLRLCDGKTPVEDLILRIDLPQSLRTAPLDEVGHLALDVLAEQELITF